MQAMVAMEAKTGKRVDRSRFVFETLGQLARAYDQAPAAPYRKVWSLRKLLRGIIRKSNAS